MTKQEIVTFGGVAVLPPAVTSVDHTWRWRDHHGQFWAPRDMETRHVFFTLRMIWNHTMPAPAQLPGGRYNFGPHYTREYMLQAVANLTPELARRPDLDPGHAEQLEYMIAWLATNQLTNNQPEKLQ